MELFFRVRRQVKEEKEREGVPQVLGHLILKYAKQRDRSRENLHPVKYRTAHIIIYEIVQPAPRKHTLPSYTDI